MSGNVHNHEGLPFKTFRRGKVRDVYDLEDGTLLVVSSDRISAFDFVLPSLIPDKGKVLNQIAAFWFNKTRHLMPNHMIHEAPETLERFEPFREHLEQRSMLVRRMKALPIEAIVRGYLVGSGWKSYQKDRTICGIELPEGIQYAQAFETPLFTPTTKAEAGHDENITFEQLKDLVGSEVAVTVRDLSLELYLAARSMAREKGIIIADTKFEFGLDDEGRVLLIDEIFTPDSSRFWRAEEYREGLEPPAYDKQFVRNHLLASTWDRESVPPPLPEEIIRQTRAKYLEIHQVLTGRDLLPNT